MPFITLSPQESELVARLLREVRGYYDDDEEKIVEIINAKENGPEGEAGDFTIDDLIMLEGKLGV